MQPVMNILVFGGSFSPPTLAHEAIIARCLGLPEFDEVWLLPSGDRLDKTIALSDVDRLALLDIIVNERFEKNPRLRISSLELDLPRPTNTFATWQALRQRFPGLDFWFALGRDSYSAMPTWEHGVELRQTLSMVVFGDRTTSPPIEKNVRYITLGPEFSDMSATQVRRALATDKSIEGLVSQPIADYLYRAILKSPSRPKKG